MAQFKLKVATLELEKLGAGVNVDKGKDGKEIATVNILKKWTGDKDAMQLLKNVPNLQVVHIDSNQVNDTALAPLKELAGFSALTITSPRGTDAALKNLKSSSGLTMLFRPARRSATKKNMRPLALHSPSSSSTTHTCGGATGFCFVVPNSPQRQMSTPARPIGMPRGSPTIGTLSKSPIITRIRPAITASRWLATLLPVFVS